MRLCWLCSYIKIDKPDPPQVLHESLDDISCISTKAQRGKLLTAFNQLNDSANRVLDTLEVLNE